MSIRIECPECGAQQTLDDAAAGGEATCEACGARLRVPAAEPEAAQQAEPSPQLEAVSGEEAPAYAAPVAEAMPAAPKTSGLAVASLIVGIVSLPLSLCCPPLSIIGALAALVMGLIAASQIGKSGGQLGGKGLAIAGIVLGALGLALGVIFLILGVAIQLANVGANR